MAEPSDPDRPTRRLRRNPDDWPEYLNYGELLRFAKSVLRWGPQRTEIYWGSQPKLMAPWGHGPNGIIHYKQTVPRPASGDQLQ